ncbi:1-phosphofructokinase family hexose kinase [Arthrobacter sp. NPDC055585]
MNVRARTGQAGPSLGRVGPRERPGGPPKGGFLAPRVVTFTPAPCVDKVYFLDRVTAGEVHRADRVDTYFAGNGVNVARSLQLAGSTVSAVLPVDHRRLAEFGYGSGLGGVVRGVDIGSPLRTNVTVVDESGMTTNFNSRPAPLKPAQWSGLCEAVIDEVRQMDADWFVLGGSLPLDASTGLPVDLRPLFARVRDLGVSICLDSPVDNALLLTWSSGWCPHLVKPNAAELSKMTGGPVRTLSDVVVAAERVRESGVDTVLASLGSDGILEVGPRGILWASGPRTDVINTTGAGDAALAGYLSVAHPGLPMDRWHAEALQRSVAWGALAVRQATTVLPHILTGPQRVQIRTPDLDHRLA